MKQFKEYLIKEAAGDKVGDPHKPLKGHVDEKTAFVVDDYPYGFNQRTQIRYWLEYKKGKGWRFVSQTLDPKRQRWNNPKASTYVEFAAFMFQDAKGYVGWKGLSQYSSLEEAQTWLKNYRNYLDPIAISLLEYVIKRKTEMGLKESSFDFKMVDGPRTKKVSGGISGAKGNSPEDALKQRAISFGYKNISISKVDGLYKVISQFGNNPSDKEVQYYQLKEAYYSNSDYSHTKQELVRSGITLNAATKLVEIVEKYSQNKFNYDGDRYPDMNVVVYPKNALNGDIGFVIYSLEKTQGRFANVYKEVSNILKKEKGIENINHRQVGTGYSFTWKKK